MDNQTKYCKFCGEGLPDEAKFCVACGGSLSSVPPQPAAVKTGRFCPACGDSNVQDAHFCHKCGRSFAKTAVPSSTGVAAAPARLGYCNGCGERLAPALVSSGLCNTCRNRDGLLETAKELKVGRLFTKHFDSEGAYQSWIERNGSRIELVNVDSHKKGWSFATGFIRSGKTHFMITYRKKQ